MQKAFKHQACLNVFDGIWKNQLTLPGWLRGALCGESLRERPSSLVPVLRAARGQGTAQEEDSLPQICSWWRSSALPGARRPWEEQGGEPMRNLDDSFQLHSGERANTATRPGFISHLKVYPKVFQEPETTVSLCQHQQPRCCPQTCFHHHTLLLSVENNPEQGISILCGDLACVWPHFPLPGEKVIVQMNLF